MAAFPTVKFYWETFEEQRGSALARSAMESGPPKQRKTQSRVMTSVKFTIAFDSLAEQAAFETWFATTINQGQDWFDWTHPRKGTVLSARFVGGSELGPLKPRNPTLAFSDQPVTLEYWSA